MAHILALEPDLRQAAILKRVMRDHVHAELTLVDSRDAAIAAIGARMPDVILLTALMSPRDEEELFSHLRSVTGSEHVQTHTIPQLAGSAVDPSERGNGKGMLGRLRRQKAEPELIAGCDPVLFAQEVASYIQRANELKSQPPPQKKRIKPVKAEPKAHPGSDAAPVESGPAPEGSAESAWSSPFEWRPAGEARAAAPQAPALQEQEPPSADVAPPAASDSENVRRADLEREEAERVRQQEEWLKINAERERIAAERKAAEAERKREEAEAAAARARNEERQRALEALREREAEQLRIEAEREAERVRMEAEREAERVRQEAERVRVEAEQEAQRLKAETERRKQEAEAAAAKQREAERLRQEAEREQERLRVEAEREKERLRVEAQREAERVRMESERVRQEAERVRVEAAREAERNRLDAEAAAIRQREAERQRKEAEREKERLRLETEREKERLRAEAERQAERVRLEAEQLRVEAERDAERLRVEAELEARRLRSEASRGRVEEEPPPPPSKRPDGAADPFEEFRAFTEFRVDIDEPTAKPRSIRLMPLSMWARVENPRVKETTAAPRDDLAELMKGFAMPPNVASVAYPRGCRIRRVRVPALPDAPKIKKTKGPVILSRSALGEARSSGG